jgi:LacI family transcriptional regulator, galactose operon repressor
MQSGHDGVSCRALLITAISNGHELSVDDMTKNRADPSGIKGQLDMRAVAQLARVSCATVSRTINHVPTVSPKLAKRVWEAIGAIGYFPNTQARALGSGKSRLLGIVASEITNPFFHELIQEFEDVAIEHGYEILVCATTNDPRRTSRCIRRMLERKVEGVAVMTFGSEEPMLEQLAERNIPQVFVDCGPDRPEVSLLKIDYHHGIRQGVQHLAALGHRKIAFISGTRGSHSSQSRVNAFIRSLNECGIALDPSWLVEGDNTMEGGLRAMETILDGRSVPSAVMCSNDMTALGVLHKAFQSGLQVPDNLSVIGFDDIDIARVMLPALTSIQLSRRELARSAVGALMAHVEGAAPQRAYHISTSLVVRGSTAYPPGVMEDLRMGQNAGSQIVQEQKAGLSEKLLQGNLTG